MTKPKCWFCGGRRRLRRTDPLNNTHWLTHTYYCQSCLDRWKGARRYAWVTAI